MSNSILIGLAIAFLVSVGLAPQATAAPRPEHPRPQAERAEWLTLNGEWEFAETDDAGDESFLGDKAYPERIVVPFCRESELSGLGHKGFVTNVWYRRQFEVPAAWKSPRVRLHLGACDWRTRVWVNGEAVGTHTGGNVAFAFDISGALKDGANTVVIHAFDDTRSRLQPLGKQCLKEKSEGIFYTRTTGIWQSVWLEGVGESFISEYRIDPDPPRWRALLNVTLDGAVEGLTLRAEAKIEGKTVDTVEADAEWRNNTLVLPVPEPHLWSVEDPFLYDLELTLLRGDQVVDEVRGYFGMRRVTVDGPAILINGKAVFQRTVLDQGFYPDGVWTAPTDEALRRDIELSQACGFNGARLHQKVFEPRFLYWADKLGYLVWGEYPSFGADYNNHAVHNPIINEWAEIVRRDYNHPAIVGWCPFNETPPEAGVVQQTVVDLTRVMDPSRPVIETSGWTHTMADPEVLDAHDYNQDPASFRKRWTETFSKPALGQLPARYGVAEAAASGLPFFVSEYGGIGWAVQEGGWGYGNDPKELEEFYTRFKGLADALLDSRYMFGLCYTQLTNVEQEQNGLYTYDRKPKFDVAVLKAALSRPAAYELEPPAGQKPLVSLSWEVLVGARQDGDLARPWRYTTEQPGPDWAAPSFDDQAWGEGMAPFGHKGGAWMDSIRTKWTSDDLWLRQRFTCEDKALAAAALVLHHDDATEIYVNGKALWSSGGWTNGYQAFDVTEALEAALVPGENVVAVHVHQDRGGQYLDLALLAGKK